MRNMKKFLALVLAMLMILSTAVITTSAADEADYTDAAYRLAALKILKGDGNNLNLENGVTRYQAALFFVQALTGKTDAGIWNADKSVYFNDVPEYGTAIDYAYGMNLIVGRGDGTYGYNDAITYQDLLVMAVRALGYETENMVYPSGYTTAAADLGLTKNIAVDVKYKDALTRGETAQIIWDMLNVEVAYTDPLSGKLVYPGEEGLLEILLDKDITRTTLLGESFADATLAGTVVEFVEATEENNLDADIVKVNVDGTVYDIVAADLGITADTKPTTYLGLPVTLYIDCAADEFVDKYEDGDASVVFANYEEYTVVENVGNEANIKVVLKNGDPLNAKTAVTLGGTKFEHGKYAVVLKVWDDAEGWVEADDQTWNNAFASFVYTNKYIGDVEANPFADYATEFNTYGKVAYRVGEKNADEKLEVEVLYTPYKFGQYNEIEVKDVKYATYTDGLATAMKLFGTDRVVSAKTTSVSKTNGAYAADVVVEGEEIESGDFMFYAYNKADNVLTVVKNCGTFGVGRLTGASTTRDTVRINGVNYGFGFEGLFTANAQTAYKDGIADSYIEALEKGKNNVKFLMVDGSIVYMGVPAAEEAEKLGDFEYVIATTAPAIMADLLEMEVEDYEEAMIGGGYIEIGEDQGEKVYYSANGVYVDEEGYAAIAVLDLTTGEWKLASLDTISVTYNAATKKFTNAVDVVNYAEFAEIGKLADSVIFKYCVADMALANGTVYALIAEEEGVYKLGAVTPFGHEVPMEPTVVANPGDAPADDAEQSVKDQYAADKAAYDKYVADKAKYDEDAAKYAANTDAFAPFATAPANHKVEFATTGRTSIFNVPGTYDEDTGAYDTTRVSTGAKTVFVVVAKDGVGVRVGKTAASKASSTCEYNLKNVATAKALAVSDELVVIAAPDKAFSAFSTKTIEAWGTNPAAAILSGNMYYVVVADSAVDVVVDEETDEIKYLVSNVYSLREKKFVDFETDVDVTGFEIGDVIYRLNTGVVYDASQTKHASVFTSGHGATTVQEAWQGINGTGSGRYEYKTIKSKVKFIDAETAVFPTTAAKTNVTLEQAITVDGRALTMNFSTLDPEAYDFSRLVLAAPIARYVVNGDVVTDVETADYTKYIEAGIVLIDAPCSVEGQEMYYVSFELTDEIFSTFTEPTEGVFNQFMIDNSGAKLLVPEMDADDYTGAQEIYIATGVSHIVNLESSTKVTVVVSNLLVDDIADVRVK